MNQKKIIQATIGLMTIVASFLPQKALAGCHANCLFGDCVYDGPGGAPYCHG